MAIAVISKTGQRLMPTSERHAAERIVVRADTRKRTNASAVGKRFPKARHL